MFELISFPWLKIRLLWDFAGSSLVKTPCFYWGVPQVQLRGATGSIPGWETKMPHTTWPYTHTHTHTQERKEIRLQWTFSTAFMFLGNALFFNCSENMCRITVLILTNMILCCRLLSTIAKRIITTLTFFPLHFDSLNFIKQIKFYRTRSGNLLLKG